MTSEDNETAARLTLGEAIEDWLTGRIVRHEIAETYRLHVRQFLEHVSAETALDDVDEAAGLSGVVGGLVGVYVWVHG